MHCILVTCIAQSSQEKHSCLSLHGQCYNGDGQDQYKEIQPSDRFIYFNHIHDGKFCHKQ